MMTATCFSFLRHFITLGKSERGSRSIPCSWLAWGAVLCCAGHAGVWGAYRCRRCWIESIPGNGSNIDDCVACAAILGYKYRALRIFK